MNKIKVLLMYIVYPLAMGSYFRRALERREDVDLKVCGPYTGNWIPWMGGMELPQKYAKPIDIPFSAIVPELDYDVVKPKMTATLEKNMDLISEGKKTLEETVDESRKMLTKVMKTLEEDKDKIRISIKNAEKEEKTVGKCPKCGKPLIIRTSKNKKRFVGCTGFPSCKNTYSLPQKGGIYLTDKVCKKCNTPIVRVKSKGKKAWELCLNSECDAKKPTKQ